MMGIPRDTNERARFNEIVRLWNETSMTQRAIGERVGLPRGSVGRLLSEAREDGRAIRRGGWANNVKPPLSEEQIAWAVEQRRAGYTLQEIADKLHRSVSRISRMLARRMGPSKRRNLPALGTAPREH